MTTLSRSSSFSDIELDAASLEQLDAAASPAIQIESPVASTSAVKVEDPPPPRRSLQERYRPYGFSVSDLVGPDWCEVQHSYNLQSRKGALPEFTTDTGKTINVDPAKLQERRNITKGGTAVHLKLEMEIMPTTVPVDAVSAVDRQGLKLLNILVGLQQLFAEGKVRELRIFGMVQGVRIRGIIDEIERRPLPAAKVKPPDPPSPDKISFYMYRGPPTKPKAPTHGYYLVDNKTRGATSLPNEESLVGARHQTMLYKMLFDVHARGAYDWDAHLTARELDPLESFTSTFQSQLYDIAESNGVEKPERVTNLFALIEKLREAFKRVGALQPTVQLVFRYRGKRPPTPPPEQQPSQLEQQQLMQAIALSLGTEDEGLAKAIALSMQATPPNKPESASQSKATPSYTPRKRNERSASPEAADLLVEAVALDQSTLGVAEMRESEAQLDLLGSLSSAFASAPPGTAAAKRSQTVEVPYKAGDALEAGTIIGRRTFTFNEPQLLEWLEQRMRYWKGERQAVGVSESQTWKCRTCEYSEGCEWLEKKSVEATRRHRQLKAKNRPNKAPPA